MTKRQQAIHRIAHDCREQLAQLATQELSGQAVGYSTIVRLRERWDRSPLRLIVTKTPEGYTFVEYRLGLNPKRFPQPKPRALPV